MADKLAVGLVSRTYFNMPLWIGLEHGLFAAEGIEIEAPILGNKPQGHKALLEGKIDAGLQSVPWNYVAEDAGMNNLGKVIDYVPNWQFVSINANSQWAAKNRELLVRFLRAMVHAISWLYANRAAA